MIRPKQPLNVTAQFNYKCKLWCYCDIKHLLPLTGTKKTRYFVPKCEMLLLTDK